MPAILRDYMATAANITQDIAPTTTAVTAPTPTNTALPPELPTNSSTIQASVTTTMRQQTRRDFLVGSGIAALAGTFAAAMDTPIVHAQTGDAPIPHMRRTQVAQLTTLTSALPTSKQNKTRPV